MEKMVVQKKKDKLIKEMEIIQKMLAIEKLKCKVCAISLESSVHLTQHIRETHHRDQVCQTTKSVSTVKMLHSTIVNILAIIVTIPFQA